jgi:hypothetical protein
VDKWLAMIEIKGIKHMQLFLLLAKINLKKGTLYDYFSGFCSLGNGYSKAYIYNFLNECVETGILYEKDRINYGNRQIPIYKLDTSRLYDVFMETEIGKLLNNFVNRTTWGGILD